MTTIRTYELVDLMMMRACMDQNLYSQTTRALALPKNIGIANAQQISESQNHPVKNGRPNESRAGGVIPPIRER